MLSGDQLRAARAILNWSQPTLASAAGVSLPTIVRMEGAAGPGRSSAANLDAVRRALENAGVIFLEEGELKPGGKGVRIKGSEV